MFELLSGPKRRMCDGLDRRGLLRAGLFGLGSLAGLTAGPSAPAAGTGSPIRKKSVVFLFLAGGPSQYETFDPKPDATETHRSLNGHIATSLPGVRFSAYLPKLAKLADRLSVVRSFQTKHAEHNGAHKQLLTADLTVQDGKPITEPGLGAVYAKLAGAVNPATGMPRHALIPPTTRAKGIRAGFNGAFESVVEGCQPAGLGTAFAPFEVLAPLADGSTDEKKKGKKGANAEEVNPFLDTFAPRQTPLQLDDRVGLLQQLDRLDRATDSSRSMERLDAFSRQAVELLRSGRVRKALDLTQEDPAIVKAYDTEHFPNWNCDDNSKFIRSGPSVGFSLGRQLLLARRLCEAGAGFVTVVNANWDFHARKGIPNMPEGMGVFAPPLDHAVAAFLEDLKQRGLEDEILLVITGEFGRSGLDKNLGRHHHPKICPLVFAGGGLRHGQVIGQSDRRGAEPSGEPTTIADLQATILHALFDVGQLRLDAGIPARVLERATRGTPIRELFS